MSYKLTLWKLIPKTVLSGDYIVNEYTSEQQIATLASEVMSHGGAAYNITLKEKINGEKTLSFNILYEYYDIDEKDIIQNPLCNLIANEAIVKLEDNGKISNFIITGIEKNSKDKTLSCSCENADIKELAKNGFHIEFDTELSNNMGNAFELAETILDDTNWTVVDDENPITIEGERIQSDALKAYTNEILFRYTLEEDISATVMDTSTTVNIEEGQVIYISQTSCKEKGNKIQFFWVRQTTSGVDPYEIDEDRCITNSLNYEADTPFDWEEVELSMSSYCGRVLKSFQKTKYLSKFGQTFSLYSKNSTTYYIWLEKYIKNCTSIQQLIFNNTNFTGTTGWTNTELVASSGATQPFWLQMDVSSGCRNNGIESNKAGFEKINGYSIMYNIILAMKVESYTGTIENTQAKFKFRSNNCSDENYGIYYQATTSSIYSEPGSAINGYRLFTLTTNSNLPYNELLNGNSYLEITGNGTIVISDIKLFIEIRDENDKIIVPDLTYVENSVITTVAKAVDEDTAEDDRVQSLYDIPYAYDGPEEGLETAGFVPIMNTKHELITSIEGKESNRFNLLQSICEKFKCWMNIHVCHDSYGKTLYSYQQTSDQIYIPGKQYYQKLDETTDPEYFGDEHFKYLNVDEIFSSMSWYYYSSKNRVYKKIEDEYIVANLGYQWKQYTSEITGRTNYYTASFDTAGNKTFTQVNYSTDTYKAGEQYYILSSGNYIAVEVGNEFDSSPSNYYLLKAGWPHFLGGDIYEKKYHKYITFNEYTGKDNYAGFKYGLNLDNVKRTLDTSNIVTKLIVKANANQYAEDGSGSCTIQTAASNSYGMSSLFNFNYYINKDILNGDQMIRDLYGDAQGNGFAYLAKNRTINISNQQYTEELATLSSEYSVISSKYQVIGKYINEAQTKYEEILQDIVDAKGAANIEAAKTITKSSAHSEKINEYIEKRDEYLTSYNSNSNSLNILKQQYNTYVSRMSYLSRKIEDGVAYLKKLDLEFYNKYNTYISEGTWTSEDYTNADSYYLAACRVLNTSSYPKVTYNFNVVDLSKIDGYEGYDFTIGDKTYIRDPEFFADQGYSALTVIVSEITRVIDNPIKNSIAVTNYATRFEDLFQRIAATTQTLQYNEGEYNRAAGSIDGTQFSSALLSRSLENNSVIISNAGAQEVKWDEEGITVSDADLAHKLRIVGGGIVLSDDGGASWRTGISTKGINADEINSGSIHADRVNIYGGSKNQLFSWDKYGLNAYSRYADEQTAYDQFVRFDRYGIYGLVGAAYNKEFISTSDIESFSGTRFALTWNGFYLHAPGEESNYVKISSTANKVNAQFYFYTQFTGTSFEQEVDYFEKITNTERYFLTEDSSPQSGKTYYTRSINTTSLRPIIDAGKGTDSRFTLYEDGSIKANNGWFYGVIQASDIVDLNGKSMVAGTRIKNKYLDLGKIKIDGNDGYITIASSYDGSGQAQGNFIRIDNNGVHLNGTIDWRNSDLGNYLAKVEQESINITCNEDGSPQSGQFPIYIQTSASCGNNSLTYSTTAGTGVYRVSLSSTGFVSNPTIDSTGRIVISQGDFSSSNNIMTISAVFTFENKTITDTKRIYISKSKAGHQGSDANVTYANVLRELVKSGNIEQTNITGTTIETPQINVTKLYGSEIYAGKEDGYRTKWIKIDGSGGIELFNNGSALGTLSVSQLSFDIPSGSGTGSDTWSYPYLRLGVGSGSNYKYAMSLKKFGNSYWIGTQTEATTFGMFPGGIGESHNVPQDADSTDYTGIAIWLGGTSYTGDYANPGIYQLLNGVCSKIGSGGGGTAVFG